MKLKDSTFAVIAEKQNSISHKWFNENVQTDYGQWMWYCKYYICKNGELWGQDLEPKYIPIYTESEFEAILKAEQENDGVKVEAKADYSKETFGTENIVINKLIEFNLNEPKQITISYNLDLEYIAERLNVDKGIIKIEMP